MRASKWRLDAALVDYLYSVSMFCTGRPSPGFVVMTRLPVGGRLVEPARLGAELSGMDVDVWSDATAANAPRLMQALAAFGGPLGDIDDHDLARPGVVFEIGVPPVRIATT